MSGSQKVIKFVSIVTIIVAILSIIAGLGLAGIGGLAAGGVSSGSVEIEGGDAAAALGITFGAAIIAIVAGVVDIIIGILGLRGAKDPNKIGAFRVFVVIGLILAVIDLIATFVLGTPDATTIAGGVVRLVLLVILLICANNVAKMRTY